MAKYDKEKNLVSTEFIADEKKRAEGLNGPQEILITFLEILKMFNPDATHNDGITKGGITGDNIREKSITEKCLSDKIKPHFHDNKSLLDGITEVDKENFEKNTEARHTHDNDEALSLINIEKINKWDKKDCDDNKSILIWQPYTEYEIGDVAIRLYIDVNSLQTRFSILKCCTSHTSSESYEDTAMCWIDTVILNMNDYNYAKLPYINTFEEHETDITVTLDDNLILSYVVQPLLFLTVNCIDNHFYYGESITFTSGETPTKFTTASPVKMLFKGDDCGTGVLVPTANKIYNLIFTTVGEDIWVDVGSREVLADA